MIHVLSSPPAPHTLLPRLRQVFPGTHVYNAGDLAVACDLCRWTVHEADVVAVKGEGATWFFCAICAAELVDSRE
jgi:hypothetical protein